MYDTLHYVDYLHIQNLYADSAPVVVGAKVAASLMLACTEARCYVKCYKVDVDA